MSVAKVAVVTGGNKGIGFEIVKGICKKFNGIVYLTSRDTKRGEAAIEKLKELGFTPRFHQLDIGDQDSINKLRDHLKSTHGGLDILINNAGVSFSNRKDLSVGTQAEETIKINYFGTLIVCEALFPLLRKNARIVNLSSYFGHLRNIPLAELRDKLADHNLTIPNLSALMRKYVEDAKAEKVEQEGWPKYAYTVSKVGVSALSIVQQRIFDKETPSRNVAVNFVHPGYVSTDMTEHKGTLTPEEGARSTLYTALDGEFKGKFVWKDCTIVDWYSDHIPQP